MEILQTLRVEWKSNKVKLMVVDEPVRDKLFRGITRIFLKLSRIFDCGFEF